MNIRVIAPAVGMVGSAEGSQLSLQFLGSHISLLSTITKELHYLKWLQQNACFEGGVPTPGNQTTRLFDRTNTLDVNLQEPPYTSLVLMNPHRRGDNT